MGETESKIIPSKLLLTLIMIVCLVFTVLPTISRADGTTITGTVAISGTVKAGQTLTATYTVGVEGETVTYQWYRGETAIEGATNTTYTLTSDDVGSTIKVIVTGSDSYCGTVSDTTTETVAAATTAITGTVAVTGTVKAGQTLTATYTVGVEGETVTYQWYRGETAIEGATNTTYTLTSDDVGSTIKVIVTGSGSYSGTATSTATEIVAAATVAVTGVSLDKTTLSLTAGGSTATLTATVAPSDATNNSVTWTSSDTGIATVSATGLVTPVAAGNATITVTSSADSTKTATCAVTVSAATVAVTGVSLDQTTLSLTAGGSTATLTATVAPSNATNNSVTWSSSDIGVATVSATGLVTPVAAGTATITVTSSADSTKTATCEVTVAAATTAITGTVEVTGDAIVGQTLTGNYKDGNAGSNITYQWWRGEIAIDSANSNSYTLVDADLGYAIKLVISGISPYTGSVSSTATAAVTKKITGSVSIEGTTEVGETLTATYTVGATGETVNYQWYREDTEITGATSSTYILTSEDLGSTITVKVTGSGSYCDTKESAATSTVTTPITGTVEISGTKTVGATLTAEYTGNAGTSLTYQWYRGSDAISGATEDEYTLTSDDLGKTIKVRVYGTDNYTSYVDSTATEAIAAAAVSVTGVTLSESTLDMTVGGGTKTLTATIEPENASVRDVTWTSDNETVATVADGVVTAVDAGTATITVKTNDGNFTDTCTVNVTKPVTGVSVTSTTLSLEVDETSNLTATVTPDDATDPSVTWSSNKTSVATVDEDGTVTAIAVGTATITVTTNDGNKTANCVVTVVAKKTAISGSVTVAGTTIVGQTLTATYTPGVTEETVTYQWYRSGDTDEAISGATSSTYKLTSDDEGKTIYVKVTGSLNYKGDILSEATEAISPYVAVTDVVLDNTTLTIAMDEATTATLTATINPSDASNQAVSWTSSNTSIVTVTADDSDSKNANLEAKAPGEATITVKTADGNKTATCSVVVTTAITGTAVITGTAHVGETLTATYKDGNAGTNITYQWYRDGSPIDGATAKTYKLVADDEGTTITVVISGKESSCYTGSTEPSEATEPVTIVPVAVTSVALSAKTLSMVAEDTASLTFTIKPANATDQTVSWSSSNDEVATVENSTDDEGKEYGLVTAVAAGTATITITTSNSQTATCKVTVIDKVSLESIAFAKESTTVPKNGTITLKPTFTPSNATNKKLTWESSDTTVATVSAKGVVKGITKGGTCTITATSDDGGFTASIEVTVTKEEPKVETTTTTEDTASSTPTSVSTVSGNSGVAVVSKISGTGATVNDVSDYSINALAASNATTVSIDVSTAKAVNSVDLSKTTFEKLTSLVNSKTNSVSSLTITTSFATVVLDKTMMKSVLKQASGNDIKLVVEPVKASTYLNTKQVSALSGREVVQTFEAHIESNGQCISRFGGGTANLSVTFVCPKDKERKYYHIYYVADNGKMYRCATTYSGNTMSFATKHFSSYAIIYDTSYTNSNGGYVIQKGDSLWKIAKAKCISLKDLIARNASLARQKFIYPGQVVNLGQ